MLCGYCFYNFDGVCASHTWLKPDGADPYGMTVLEIAGYDDCTGFRPPLSFMADCDDVLPLSTEDGDFTDN